MKRRLVLLLLGIYCLAGCAPVKKYVIEPKPGAIAISDEVAPTDTEVVDAATTEAETTIEEEQVAMSVQEQLMYNDFLSEYKTDLGRISIVSNENFEMVDHGDTLELKNAIVYKDYYLDAATVETAKVGDTITIKDIPYEIKKMEKTEEKRYDVELLPLIENDWEEDIWAYEDIYAFESRNGGKNYSITFCSDDTIVEEIYKGSVFIAKDATINAYVGEQICDLTVKEYMEKAEYPHIATWSFRVNEEGLITFIQNQLAG